MADLLILMLCSYAAAKALAARLAGLGLHGHGEALNFVSTTNDRLRDIVAHAVAFARQFIDGAGHESENESETARLPRM